MALEAFVDSNCPLESSSMTSAPVNGDLVLSSNSDNVQQKDVKFSTMLASLFSAASGSTAGISPKVSQPNVGVISSGINPTTLGSLTNMEHSLGMVSSVAEANSSVQKSPNMHRCAATGKGHRNSPALLFASYNSSVWGSPTASESSTAPQDSDLGQNCSQVKKRKRQPGGVTAKSKSKKNQNPLLNGEDSEHSTSDEMYRKIGFDMKRDGVLHQHIPKQQLQSGDYAQFQSNSPLLEALIQQHKLEHQKQQNVWQIVPDLPGVDSRKQRQQQMRDYLQQLEIQQVHHVRSSSSNVCSRRLSQYMYHLQQRPPNNSIAYWRAFVTEYYDPCAKKRWCLSLCNSVRLHGISIFPQTAMETWKCELCGTTSGRGFEAIFEILPRLYKIQFESGIFDELLFLELPREYRLPSGLTVLEYGKAVHETVFERFRIVREGLLRIVFSSDLKILSWEFCSRDHEELLHRSLIASQVNEFVSVAEKYQEAIGDSGSDKASQYNLEENQAMLLSAGCKLEKNLDQQMVGELGFSKRYIRCLQIAEIFSNMRDLMTFSWKNKIGPIESLNNYSQNVAATKLHKDESLPKEKLDTTNLFSTSHGHRSNRNDYSNISKDGHLTTSEKATLAIASRGDYCKLLRQASVTSDIGKLGEPSGLFNCTDHNKEYQGANSLELDFTKNFPCSSSHFPESNRNAQDRMIQKLILEMLNNSKAANRIDKEATNHNINDILGSKWTYGKGTG